MTNHQPGHGDDRDTSTAPSVRCPDGLTATWPCTGRGVPVRAAVTRRLEPGEVIVHQGQLPAGVWLIEHGRLQAICHRGEEKVVAEALRPGHVVGDLPLLAGAPAPATVRAVTPAVASFLDATTFRELLRRKPAIARCWLRLVARRALAVQARAVDATWGGSAAARVARMLLRQAESDRVQCTQADIAAMTGIRRPTVNRVLRQFERDGLARRGYRSIELVSRAGLRRVGDENNRPGAARAATR